MNWKDNEKIIIDSTKQSKSQYLDPGWTVFPAGGDNLPAGRRLPTV